MTLACHAVLPLTYLRHGSAAPAGIAAAFAVPDAFTAMTPSRVVAEIVIGPPRNWPEMPRALTPSSVNSSRPVTWENGGTPSLRLSWSPRNW